MFNPESTKKEILPQYRKEVEQKIPDWVRNEALLIDEALDKGAVTKEEAEFGLSEEKELLEMMRKMVDIKYFVEYPPEVVQKEKRGEKLLELFQQEFQDKDGKKKILADFLAENRQGVSLAISSRGLDEKTAKTIRYLNEKKVPVVGWVVLDDLKGYWTNPTNIPETKQKTEEIKKWAKENELQLIALGFDLEKPLSYLKALCQGNVREILKEIRNYRKKVKERKKEGNPKEQLAALIEEIRKEGAETEVYAFPKFLKKLLGGMDLRTADRYVEMLYSTSFPKWLRGKAVKFLRTKGAIPALGIVSGKEKETPGRMLGTELPRHLTQEELERDLKLILGQELDIKNRKFTLRNLYLFALNDARVALMMDAALRQAFQKKQSAVKKPEK